MMKPIIDVTKSRMRLLFCFWVLWLPIVIVMAYAQIPEGTVVVRPKGIDHVLNNPGIGFTTFQRFNGDDLNKGSGWTEGFPIEYQEFDGDLTNKDYPETSIAYFRVYWKFMEQGTRKMFRPGTGLWSEITRSGNTITPLTSGW